MTEIFLGREQEEREFTKVLKSLVSPDSNSRDDGSPYIFLYYGTGGIGKTTLLKKLKNISTSEFPGQFNTIFLDWEEKRDRDSNLQVGNDNIQPTTVLEVIYQSFAEIGWGNNFSGYRNIKDSWEEAKKKITKELESKIEDEKVQELRPLGTDGIAELLRGSQGFPLEIVSDKKFLMGAREANLEEEEFEEASKFVKSCLSEEELEVYLKPEDKLADNLGIGITNLAKEKPLIIFFDTYEIVDRPECDYILRYAIASSIGPVVWVIASRTNLADSGWRNPEAKKALLGVLQEEYQDPDVLAVAIRLLGNFDNALVVRQLVSFLKHPDRYVRAAAARELGNMAKKDTDKKTVLEQAAEPLIQVMRNNPISDVRDKAFDTVKNIYIYTHLSKPQSTEITKVKRALWREKDKLDQILQDTLEGERKNQFQGRLKADNLQTLIQGLKDPSPEIRERSAELLGKPEYKEAVNELVDLLAQPNEDPDVRATVAETLGKIELSTEKVINALINTLDFNKEKDRYVRQESAKTLGKLTPTEASINALNKAVRVDVISNVRDAAKDCLTDISTKGSDLAKKYLQLINQEKLQELNADDINKMLEALADEDPDICAAAAKSLGQIKNSSVIEVLLKKLNYKDRIAREAVVTAIGDLEATLEQLDKTQAVEELIEIWRNDPIKDVRNAVEESLKNIYKRTRHPNAYKALNRYSNPDKKEEYDQLFKEFPPNEKK
ncbi:MAG: HEAT repeat domain-containing protein [Rivularia sp. (in: cyanobacteria)]